jgi:hypothetical protein
MNGSLLSLYHDVWTSCHDLAMELEVLLFAQSLFESALALSRFLPRLLVSITFSICTAQRCGPQQDTLDAPYHVDTRK